MSKVPVQIQEKVTRLTSRINGKAVLKPHRPLILKDAVANRRPNKGEATCVTEMSMMMSCWKNNNFVEALCPRETEAFFSCVKKTRTAQVALKNSSGVSRDGKLTPKLANTLLKRFPNLRTEI